MTEKITVKSFNHEFGYELISVIPFAYWLHVNGLLEKTISAELTEPLYYFSPNHEIDPTPRGKQGKQFMRSKIPNKQIHKPALNTSRFYPPPYKEVFKSESITWDKPTICICNRYNMEWQKPPINFFSLEVVEQMFKLLQDDFQIVYFGVDILDNMQDLAHNMPLGDVELCQEYPRVILFQDLLKTSQMTWNELMLRVFAGCDNYITMNGGYSIMASYFGGTNLIYCKEAKEVHPKVDSFNKWYHLFGGSDIVVTRTYDELIDKVKSIWHTKNK
jgi:hypothetical protein